MDWDVFFRKNLEPVQAYRPGLREEQIWQLVETDRIYKLSSNESPLPPFPSALEALKEQLTTLNEYPDGSAFKLTQLLSWHYDLPFDQITVGNGSNELIDLIAMTCLDPGDNIVYGWPSFVVYRSCAQIAGAEPREVGLRDDGSFDLDAMLERVDERTKIVFICTPNNPSGAVISAEDFESFMTRVPEQVLVVVDAAYEEFVDDQRALKPLEYFDGQKPYVVLRTFSKIYALAGLRCGYGFAPTVLVEMLNKVREPFNVNTLAQVAAIACLEDNEELERRFTLNRAGRRQLEEHFASLGLHYFPSQANFVYVSVPEAAKAFDTLLRKGIIVRPVPGTEALRVGVGDAEAVQATATAFSELFG